MEVLLIVIFVVSQINIPAGIDMYIALPRTNIVLSSIDLMIVSSIFGFLYGGSSKVNDEGSPFKMVFERIFEINRVTKTENTINPKRVRADSVDDANLLDAPLTKKMEIIAIRVGNLPLQGENTLVRIAISFSFFDWIILHPITPHALQPYPMHIVRDCFP